MSLKEQRFYSILNLIMLLTSPIISEMRTKLRFECSFSIAISVCRLVGVNIINYRLFDVLNSVGPDELVILASLCFLVELACRLESLL